MLLSTALNLPCTCPGMFLYSNHGSLVTPVTSRGGGFKADMDVLAKLTAKLMQMQLEAHVSSVMDTF